VIDRITLPDWCSRLDQRHIDDAVAQATALTVLPPKNSNNSESGLAFINLQPVWPSVAVAIHGVLIILEAIASTMVRYRGRRQRATLQLWTDKLRDEVIVWAEQYTLGIGLDEFNGLIDAELRTRSWWPAFVSCDLPLSSPAKETFGAWVKRHRLECRWTVDELAEKVKLHRTSVDNHEHDRGALRAPTIGKYERAFTKALGHKIKWPHKLR
jgi:hypothetical protein